MNTETEVNDRHESIESYLKENFKEQVPRWLANYSKGLGRPPMREFLASRTVFYPGCGFDTDAILTFGLPGSAHCFVQADYLLPKEELLKVLDKGHGTGETEDDRIPFLEGYEVYDRVVMTGAEVAACCPWSPHVTAEEERHIREGYAGFNPVEMYGVFVVFTRSPDRPESYGPDRLALWYIGGDGFATYDAVYGNHNASAPFGLLQQDHGFGGNYDRFGRGGLLERIARRAEVYPKFILSNAQEDDLLFSYVPNPFLEPGDRRGRFLCCYGY